MPKPMKFFVLQTVSGVAVAGSEHNDTALQAEADEIGGAIIDPEGNIVYDARGGELISPAKYAAALAAKAAKAAKAVKAKAAADAKQVKDANQ